MVPTGFSNADRSNPGVVLLDVSGPGNFRFSADRSPLEIWVITAGHWVWITKPATMPVSVGVKPVLPCNSDSVVASDEPGLTRLGQIDWPNFSMVALIEPLSFGVVVLPESACAGATPTRMVRPMRASNGAERIEPITRIDFTPVTLVHNSHISDSVA